MKVELLFSNWSQHLRPPSSAAASPLPKVVCLSAGSQSSFCISWNLSTCVLKVENGAAVCLALPYQVNSLVTHNWVTDTLYYSVSHSNFFSQTLKNHSRTPAVPQPLPPSALDSPTKPTKFVIYESKFLWSHKGQLYSSPTSSCGTGPAAAQLHESILSDGAFATSGDSIMFFTRDGVLNVRDHISGSHARRLSQLQFPSGTKLQPYNMVSDQAGGLIILCYRSNNGPELDLYHLSRAGSLKRLNLSCPEINADQYLDGILAISASSDGHLLLADAVNVYHIPLSHLRNPLLQFKSCNLEKSIGILTDSSITIGDTSVSIHRALASARCPQFFSWKSSAPLSSQGINTFIKFLYSDILHLNGLTKRQLLDLAMLLEINGFQMGSHLCLTTLESTIATLNDAFALYRHSLDLNYSNGVKLLKHILYLVKKDIVAADLPNHLQNHADKVWDLVQIMMQDSPPELLKIVDADDISLSEALRTLYTSRDSADFQILLGDETILVHSFVLYARWPYMSRILASGMKEAQSKVLKLPPAGADGAITALSLEVALELCYTGILSAETTQKMTPSSWLHILSVKDLYFDGATFEELIEFAEGEVGGQLDLNHCVELLKTSYELGVEDLQQKSLAFIVAHLDKIKTRPDLVASMLHLPEPIYRLIVLQMLSS